MNNIGYIIKNKHISNISDQELQKYDDYISNILYEHENDIVKTFDYKNKQLLFKNYFILQFNHNFNNIIIKGKYDKPFIGKLQDLSDVTLSIIINKQLFKYYKI